MEKLFSTDFIWTPEWTPENQRERRIVCFRRRFAPGELPQRLRVTADSRYKLYLNGEFVGKGPQKGNLETWYADTLDLTGRLREGENVLAAEVLRYPRDIQRCNESVLPTAWPCFYIQGITGDGWRCRISGTVVRREDTSPAALQFYEDAAGEESLHGWKRPGYDDSAWAPAEAYSALEMDPGRSPANLQERSIPLMAHEPGTFREVVCRRDGTGRPVRQGLEPWEGLLSGKPVTIPARTTETVELGAGALECAYLRLALAGGKGAKITLTPGECYSIPMPPRITPIGEMPQSRKEDRTDFEQGVLIGPEDYYQVGGFGGENDPEEVEPFWFRTFRYLQVRVETGDLPLTVLALDYRTTGYPLEVKTMVQASDESFGGIWEISLRTLRRCMQETYFDCPFYEQLAYAMDGRSEMLYTYAVSGDDRLARVTMEDFRRSQRGDGMINASAPSNKTNVIPGFAVYYVCMVHDHMEWFGDRKLVRRHLPAVQGILEFFGQRLTPRGLVRKIGGPIMSGRYWSFIDWDRRWNETTGVPRATLLGEGSLTMESLLYLMGLQKGAELAEYVGWVGLAQEYRDRSRFMKEALRQECFGTTEVDGRPVRLLRDGPGVDEYSTHCQVFGILTEVLTREEGRAMLEATLGRGEQFPQCSVAMRFYLFRALEKLGWFERADPVWDLWRQMLDRRLTTCVENDTDQRSDCHGWGATLLYELPVTYLGVRPDGPGFEKIRIAPVAGHLTWCEGTVITPKGEVWVRWEKQPDGSLAVKFRAPEGVEVRVEKG